MSCFQCDLDIPHVCYAGDPNARWGLHDGAIDALEAANRYLRGGLAAVQPAPQKKKVMPMTAPFRIPEGWTIELLPRSTDHMLISTPPPNGFMATIDLKARGFRGGYSTTGMLVGEAWNTKRKKYGGRNWKQAIVDDAVEHLKGVLR